MTGLGKPPRAFFKVQLPAKPPEPAKEQSFILSPGEREGQIEVVEIDDKLGSIKFNNYGTVQTLSLEKDGAKLPNTPPSAVPVPGAVGFVPPPVALPGTSPNPAFGSPNGGGLKTIPTRSLRLPQNGSTGAPYTGASMPSYGIAQPMATGQQTSHQQPQMSREEQLILMEVERERTRPHVQTGDLPPLPPTELTPPGAPGIPPAPQ
jgi:hypothetical protein